MTTMRLSYVPIPESHHVYLNGREQQEGVDWTDDGTGLLTFLGPMAERSGDKIEVLYAHQGLIEPLPPATFPRTASVGEEQFFTHVITYPTAPPAGYSIMLAYRPKFGGATSSVSGMGAIWTKLVTYGAQEIWVGIGCDGVGSSITVVGDHVMNIDTVEVDRSLTTTGVVVDSGVNIHVASVVAGEDGIAYGVRWGGSGIGTTPATGWYEIPKGNVNQGSQTYIIAATAGVTYDIHTNFINSFESVACVAVPYS